MSTRADSTAPERIWADRSGVIASTRGPREGFEHAYVRADIVVALETALVRLLDYADEPWPGDRSWVEVETLARNALAHVPTETPTTERHGNET